MAEGREQALIQQLEKAQAQNAALLQERDALQQEIKVLRLKVDSLARRIFGQSSEKLDPAQLELLFNVVRNEAVAEQEDQAGASGPLPPAASKSAKPRTKRKLEDVIAELPVTEVIIDPAEVMADPDSWECIGAEETKLIDFTPGKFSCRRLRRRKYVRKDQRHLAPVTAPLTTLQERCMATPALLAHTLSLRYEMHLPFYRIEQMYERLGVPISRQTMCNWSAMSAGASGLVREALRKEVFEDGYVQIDETPVKYQDPGRKGVCGTGWLWVIYNPVRQICFFEWRLGRGAKELQSIVPVDFEGTIQCDGHSAYSSFASSPERFGKITLTGCLAHARRKFFEAKAEGEDAQWVLAQIQRLYQIEAELAQARAAPEQVLRARQNQSAVILKEVRRRLEDWRAKHKHLPRSLTGEAITYSCNQWERLEGYLHDGRLRIDNNLVENAIRPSAIGKKNWLFMGDRASGERAAMFYTLIANCHRAEIDVAEYLTDLFTQLPTHTTKTVYRLTPSAWAAHRKNRLAEASLVGATIA